MRAWTISGRCPPLRRFPNSFRKEREISMRASVIAVATVLALVLLVTAPQAAEYAIGPDSLMLEIRETVVVDTGYLYLHGNPIEPPYLFTIAGDSLYAELYINDYIAHWGDTRPPDRETLSPRVRLDYEIIDLMVRMRKEGTSTVMERTEAAAELYREHPELVERVSISSPGNLSVVFIGSFMYPNPEGVTVESGRRLDPPTAYETVANRMDLLVHRLSMGWTAFHWKGMGGYYPALPDSGFAAWCQKRPSWLQRLYEDPLPLEKRRR